MQKTCTIPDTFLILFNGQKLNFIFPLHPVCMNKIMKNKSYLKLATSLALGCKAFLEKFLF